MTALAAQVVHRPLETASWTSAKISVADRQSRIGFAAPRPLAVRQAAIHGRREPT